MMVAVEPPVWRVIGFARQRTAELYWATGEKATARAMANAALEALAQDPHAESRRQGVREWLAAHPRSAPRRSAKGPQRSAPSVALHPSP